MERLWSPAVATGGNRWQIERPRKRLKQAKTVADGCDQLPGPQNGKEGVDGSSPSEGLHKSPANRAIVLPATATHLVSSRVRDGYILGLARIRSLTHSGNYGVEARRLRSAGSPPASVARSASP